MIRVEKLAIRQGHFALEDISFEVPQGEYAVLMGRTGTGKSTLLECICGLRKIKAGRITLHDQDVTRLKASLRGVGYVPQDAALFNTMTVWDNLAFALVVRKRDRDEISARVQELAELLGIGHLLFRRPTGLSGGECQRVALGRALAYGPSVLCLDEPLSAIDEETRGQMYDLLKKVQAATAVTVLHVTHSSTEARALADRLLVLEEGAVRQVPLEKAGEPEAGEAELPLSESYSATHQEEEGSWESP